VITGDLDVALAEIIGAATGEPGTGQPGTGQPGTGQPGTAGTWRPAPPGASGGPGTYATTIAFLLARQATTRPRHAELPPQHAGDMPQHPAAQLRHANPHASDPQDLATRLAASLRARREISQATVTGGGYLTITVTAETLSTLAVRIAEAGPSCARGGALRGVALEALRGVDLATARDWDEAYQWLASEVTGRLAAAAGAQVQWADPMQRTQAADSRPTASRGPVSDSINYAGADAIRYALGRLRRRPGGLAVDARAAAEQHLGNPAYAVRYAHAHAASALRQAADLGLDKGGAADAEVHLLAHPSERALLDAMSWLPERVGGAARRGRPDVLTGYLEDLAAAYLGGQESCPAAPPGLLDEPPGSPVTRARLWLAAAAGAALGAGLGLLGVAAPDRL
jgi:arginyl-tRNA synthetase